MANVYKDIFMDVASLETHIPNLKNLKTELSDARTNSGYTVTANGNFQSKNGISALSCGKTVRSVSYLDAGAYSALLYWEDTVENLANFLEKSVEAMRSADEGV